MTTINANYPDAVSLPVPEYHSCPEPDLAWVARCRYFAQHPNPVDIHLLIEVSFSSSQFDTTEKQRLYASAGVVEYWQVDVPKRTVTVYQSPQNGSYALIALRDVSESISPQCCPEAMLQIKDLFVTE
jgi:Uma2 family endonuclease